MKLFVLSCLLIGWIDAAAIGETVVTTYERPVVPIPFEKYGPPPPGAPQTAFVPVVQTAYTYDVPEYHPQEQKVIVPAPLEAAVPLPEVVEVAPHSTVVLEETKPTFESQSVSVHTKSSYSYNVPEAPYQSEVQEKVTVETEESGKNGEAGIDAPFEAPAIGEVVETSYSYELPENKVQEQQYSYSDESGKVVVSVVGVSPSEKAAEEHNESITVEQPFTKVVVEQPVISDAVAEQPIASGPIVQTSYVYEVPEYIEHAPVPLPNYPEPVFPSVVAPYEQVHERFSEVVAPHPVASGGIVQTSYAYEFPEYIPHGPAHIPVYPAPAAPAEFVVAPHEEVHTEVTEVVAPHLTPSGQIVQTSYAYGVPEYIPHGPAHIPAYPAPVAPAEFVVAPHEEVHAEVTEVVAPHLTSSGQVVQTSYAYGVPEYIPHGPAHIPAYPAPVTPAEFVEAAHEEDDAEIIEAAAPHPTPSGQIVETFYAYEVPEHVPGYVPYAPPVGYAPPHPVPAEVAVAPHHEDVNAGYSEVVVSQPAEVIGPYAQHPFRYNPIYGDIHGQAVHYYGQQNCYGAGQPFFYPGSGIFPPSFPAPPAFPVAVQPHPIAFEEHKPYPPTVVEGAHGGFAEQAFHHPMVQVIVAGKPYPPFQQTVIEHPQPATQVIVEDSKPYPPEVIEQVIAADKPFPPPFPATVEQPAQQVAIEQDEPIISEVVVEDKPYPPPAPFVVEQHAYQPPNEVVFEQVAPFIRKPHFEPVVEKFGPYPPAVEVVEEKTYPYPPAL